MIKLELIERVNPMFTALPDAYLSNTCTLCTVVYAYSNISVFKKITRWKSVHIYHPNHPNYLQEFFGHHTFTPLHLLQSQVKFKLVACIGCNLSDVRSNCIPNLFIGHLSPSLNTNGTILLLKSKLISKGCK